MGHGALLGCLKTGSPRARRVLGAVCCGVALVSSSIAKAEAWTTHGPGDGNVNATAIDPATPTTVYAGTDRGGFFKSLNGGETWSPASAGVPEVAGMIITGIPIDPVTPARVYASASLGLEGGVLRSTDAGASWSFTTLKT